MSGNDPSYLKVHILKNEGDYQWLPIPMPYVQINNGPGGKVIVAPEACKRIFIESFNTHTGAYSNPKKQAWATNQATGETQIPSEALPLLESILHGQNFKTFQS